METLREIKNIYAQEKASQDRMDAVRTIPYAKKLRIAIDLDLIPEDYLDELVYDSDLLYEELLDESLPF